MGRDGPGVRAASETSIEITFKYRGIRCRERIKLKPTPANLKAAARHKAAIEDAIARGTFDYAVTFPDSPKAALFADKKGQVITAGDFLDGWLTRQKQHIKTSTWADYRKTVINHLAPAFGALKLSELKRSQIRTWCDSLTCSNKRIANLLSPLRVALQESVEDDLIDANPLYGWSYVRKTTPKTASDIDPFSPEEQAAILDNLQGQGRNLIQFAFWTGLRTSELVALEWGDMDRLRGTVRISRAHTQASDEPESPKTKAGAREIILLPPAMAAIDAQREHSLLHPSGRVFLNPRTGLPWEGDQPIRKTLWTHALKKAGVRYRRPYQTRHTYASMMLSAGESPMWVAAQMGHADWTMIARVYGRWIPAADPNAGSRAVATFWPANAGIKAGITEPEQAINSHKK